MDVGFPGNIHDEVRALKRRRIVEVAAHNFAIRGYTRVSLEDVAKQVGATKPFIYSFFPSKQDLLAEICSSGIESSLAVMEAVTAEPGDARDRLRSLIKGWMKCLDENSANIIIYRRDSKYLRAHDKKKIKEKRRQFDRSLRAILQDGKDTGTFTITNPRIAAYTLGGMVSWIPILNQRFVARRSATVTSLAVDMIEASVTKEIPNPRKKSATKPRSAR